MIGYKLNINKALSPYQAIINVLLGMRFIPSKCFKRLKNTVPNKFGGFPDIKSKPQTIF